MGIEGKEQGKHTQIKKNLTLKYALYFKSRKINSRMHVRIVHKSLTHFSHLKMTCT